MICVTFTVPSPRFAAYARALAANNESRLDRTGARPSLPTAWTSDPLRRYSSGGPHAEAAVRQSAEVIHADPDILSGTPVFVGTRVPAQALFDYLEGGETLDAFLLQFPSVTREKAIAALDLARDSLLANARSA